MKVRHFFIFVLLNDIEDLKNCKPESLLSKYSQEILMNRIEITLDSSQPREQAGFRNGYCKNDHAKLVGEVMSWDKDLEHLYCDVRQVCSSH